MHTNTQIIIRRGRFHYRTEQKELSMCINIGGPPMKEHAMKTFKQNTCPGAEHDTESCL